MTAREWGAYPIIKFPDVPKIDVLMLPRQDQPPLGVGESASVPSAAAIANAIFDATGVRFRELPFTPERILRGLHGEAQRSAAMPCRRRSPRPCRTNGKIRLPAGAARWRQPRHSARPWSASARRCCRGARSRRSRGRMHRSIRPQPSPAASNSPRSATARSATPPSNGVLNAGGRPLETPFGTIYTTNITPDVETGIGAWSYPAFERAMREGIHRDGRHLYPAFPYTHFAKTTDADLQALYAYLMAQSPVRAENADQRAGVSVQPASAAGGMECAVPSAPKPFQADATKSEIWNRGAYLVEGLGHCSACHSPRNALGAERQSAYLAGGFAEGWEAPALTSLSQAPIPWSEDELFAYLRTGESRFHGVAAGPMAPVVKELAALPDQDIRAMAVYLASFNDNAIDQAGAGGAGRQTGSGHQHQNIRGIARRRPALSGRLRGLPRGRRRAAVRQPAVAGAEQQSAQRRARTI